MRECLGNLRDCYGNFTDCQGNLIYRTSVLGLIEYLSQLTGKLRDFMFIWH